MGLFSTSTTVQGHINSKTRDLALSDDDLNLILSDEDGWFSAPVSLGNVLHTEEFQALEDLRDKLLVVDDPDTYTGEDDGDVVYCKAEHLQRLQRYIDDNRSRVTTRGSQSLKMGFWGMLLGGLAAGLSFGLAGAAWVGVWAAFQFLAPGFFAGAIHGLMDE